MLCYTALIDVNRKDVDMAGAVCQRTSRRCVTSGDEGTRVGLDSVSR